MEEMYVNVEHVKPHPPLPVSNHPGSNRLKKRLSLNTIITFGLVNVFLLAGLVVILARCMMASDFCNHGNLTECVQASNNILSSLIAEIELLKANLTAMTTEPIKLRESVCPTGWINLRFSCYLLSPKSDSWDNARKDCRKRGADLIVINNADEQKFLAADLYMQPWIGLNDIENEGSWKWVDGTTPDFKNWIEDQPDNGGTSGEWGEEDCAHVYDNDKASWNDASCAAAKRWICEKVAV